MPPEALPHSGEIERALDFRPVERMSSGEPDEFGYIVALTADGAILATSAPFEAGASTGIGGNQNDNSAPSAGAVYVFQ